MGFIVVADDGSEHEMSDQEQADFFEMLKVSNDYLTERDGGDAWKAAAQELTDTVQYLEVDSIGGYVPIQGEGIYEGEPFYFRARGQWATLSVGFYDDTVLSPKRHAGIQCVPDDDPYGAGYLTPGQCVTIIRDYLIPNLQPMEKR